MRDTLRVGRASAATRLGRVGPLPDYLIIGAQRSGTTWLHGALTTHAAIEAPLTKEVHYFDRHWHRGVKWYRANFANGPLTCTGESTPYTLFHPRGARRVAATVPGVRLIVVLRDPVARAWSHWAHSRHLGVEPHLFDRAIELEEERLAGADALLRDHDRARHRSHQHHSYMARGRYAIQLADWLRYFDSEQLLVVWSDDLLERPLLALGAVTNHLGLDPFVSVPTVAGSVGTPRRIDHDTAGVLRRRFEADDHELAELLGDIPPWRR